MAVLVNAQPSTTVKGVHMMSRARHPEGGQQEHPVKKHRLGGRSAQVRLAVFAATMELLQARGYEALSIAEVAAHAGVHESSIYRRWKSKETLVLEMLRARAREELPMPDTGTLRSDLVALLREVMQYLQSPVGWAMLQVRVLTRDQTLFAPVRHFYWADRLQQFSVLVERAKARGEVPIYIEPQFLFESLIGPVYVRFLVTDEPLDETLPERIVDFVLDAVRHVSKE